VKREDDSTPGQDHTSRTRFTQFLYLINPSHLTLVIVHCFYVETPERSISDA
jgi:hypothetical protein